MKYIKLVIIAGIFFLFSCNRIKDNFQYKLRPVKIENKWGYINDKGKIIINPQFDEAFLFSDDIALVKVGNLYGYISEDGRFLIDPVYIGATCFDNGLALVVKEDGYPTFIDEEGKIKFAVSQSDQCRLFKEELAAFKSDFKWGFIDKTGRIAIKPQFDKVDDFSEGLAVFGIENNQKIQYGYINSKGNVVINLQFDEAYKFVDGLALVKQNDKYRFIDKSGKFVINAQFEYACSFNDGLSLIKSGDKYGFIDKSGKSVINPQFEKASSFNDGLALAISDDKYGYINKQGNFEINAQFDEAYGFKNKLAPVKVNDKYGFINAKGKIVINPQFDAVYDTKSYKNYVSSDYLNTKLLVAFFMDKTDGNNFKGISKNTDYDYISKEIHKNDKLSESGNILTVEIDKDIDNYARIENIRYTFTNKINKTTTTAKFLYHRGNYSTGGVKRDKDSGSKVSAVEVEMYLYGCATDKDDKIIRVLGNKFSELLKVKPIDIPDGMLIESSDLKVEITSDEKLQTGKIFVKVSF